MQEVKWHGVVGMDDLPTIFIVTCLKSRLID